MHDFEIPTEMLDDIQLNIENLINGFDIPDDNKLEVLKKINFMYTRTKQMTVIDPLTGMYNRRHFETNFEREFMRAKRYGNDLTIAVIDVDNFKNINDTYGHSFGDNVLRDVGFLANNTIRTTDMIFRYGGEEFVVILTETPIESAMIPLERLRKAVEEYPFIYKDEKISVTISVGINANIQVENSLEMFDMADKALYKAKTNGKNQIQVF